MHEIERLIRDGKSCDEFIEISHPKRFNIWFAAAEGGNVTSQWLIGRCFELGLGLAKSISEAIKWYRKAAEQDHVRAQYDLGRCHENETGSAVNVADAVGWYYQAAKNGHAKAQVALAECYYHGKGVLPAIPGEASIGLILGRFGEGFRKVGR